MIEQNEESALRAEIMIGYLNKKNLVAKNSKVEEQLVVFKGQLAAYEDIIKYLRGQLALDGGK